MPTQLLSNDQSDMDSNREGVAEAFSRTDTTLHIPPEGLRNALRRDLQTNYVRLLESDSLGLFINREKQPILIQREVKTILGRYKSVSHANVVDLSIYYAHLLGVSREHAAIVFTDSMWTVEDLDSSNGTWVNDQQLIPYSPFPVQNGDTIRLAQLLMTVSI